MRRALALCLALATGCASVPPVASRPLASDPIAGIETLEVGKPYTPSEPGAFVTDARAAVMRAAFDRELRKSDLCLHELEKKPSTVAVRPTLIAGGLGLAVGIALGVLAYGYADDLIDSLRK